MSEVDLTVSDYILQRRRDVLSRVGYDPSFLLLNSVYLGKLCKEFDIDLSCEDGDTIPPIRCIFGMAIILTELVSKPTVLFGDVDILDSGDKSPGSE
jgi:hypothetical protein